MLNAEFSADNERVDIHQWIGPGTCGKTPGRSWHVADQG